MKIKKIAIIIGTQKGGTSSLFKYLSQHPQVSASKVKETNFFLKDTNWDKGIAHYESLWEWDQQKHLVALEASPNYTNSFNGVEKVIKRLQTTNIDFKFIYLLRDPIQKIESMRAQGVYQGWYTKRLERETLETLPSKTIEPAKYASIADQFVKKYSKQNLLLLKTEELGKKESSGVLMAEICEFLEIDPAFKFNLESRYNTRNVYRKDTAWSVLMKSKYSQVLKRIWHLFPDASKTNLRNLLSKPLEKNKIAPPLTEKQKNFILDALSNEMLRLERDYEFDLSGWNIQKTTHRMT